MALTRRFLKALDIDSEKIEEIITEHTETVNALKEQVATYKADAEKLPEIQKKLDAAKSDLESAKNDGYRDKYEGVKKELDNLKSENAKKEARAAKETAAREYFREKGITTDNALKLALRSSGAEIDALELGDDGKVKDLSGLDALVAGDLSALVSKKSTKGADTQNPANTGTGKLTRKDIMAITDRAERRKAIAENLEAFQKGNDE